MKFLPRGGKHMKTWIRNKNWLQAFLLAICLFVVTAVVMPITYTCVASDDRFLAAYLAGYWSGVQENSLPFINPIFSKFVSFLYRIVPSVHWYADLHVAVLFMAYVMIARCVFLTAKEYKIHWAIAWAMNIAVYFIAFCYNVTWLSFTLTPALACAGAAAIILCCNFKDKSWIFDGIISVLMIFVAYIWRSSSALAGICFCVGAVVWRLVNIFLGQEGGRKKAFIQSGSLVASAVILIGLGSWAMNVHKNDPELADYYAFRASCTQYLDYPGSLTYAQDPTLYDSLGISPYLENLARHWFFMDEAITADAFNALSGVEDPSKIESFADTHFTPRQALVAGRNLFRDDATARWLLYPCLALFMIGCIQFLWEPKRNLIAFLMIGCFSLGAFALCFYLCLLGRFPVRTFGTISAGYMTVSVLLCGRMYTGAKKQNVKTILVKICSLCLVGVILLVGARYAKYVLCDQQEQKNICVEQATAVETLAVENPENIYIFDFMLAMCNVAYPDYGDQAPTNLFYWGGSYLGTEGFDKQMALNGIENFDASLFLQDNVYFVTWEPIGEIHSLWPFMNEEYGAVSYEVVEKMAWDTITVYKFN